MNEIDLIKNFKYISKENEFFLEGIECTLISDKLQYSNDMKFKEYFGLFKGYSIEQNNEYPVKKAYLCEDFCDFDEFYIYDIFNNEISELSMNEYKHILRKEKIKKVYE